MNKILIFLLLSCLAFPCEYLNDGELFTRLGIATVKELKYDSKLVCDEEDDKSVYIYEDDVSKDALLFGFEMSSDFLGKDYIKEMNKSLDMIQKTNSVLNKKIKALKAFGNNTVPEYVDFTFYVQDAGELEEVFSLEIYILDGANHLYLSEKYRDKLESLDFGNDIEIFWY